MEIRCKTCDQGTMSIRRVHRLSGPAVVIGYILLIPSAIGFAVGAIVLALTWMVAAGVIEPDHDLLVDTEVRLRRAKVPEDLIDRLKKGEQIADWREEHLNDDQRAAIREAEAENAASGGGGCLAGCGTTTAITLGVLSLVVGLIGWLLVMRKRVLVCSACSASTDAL